MQHDDLRRLSKEIGIERKLHVTHDRGRMALRQQQRPRSTEALRDGRGVEESHLRCEWINPERHPGQVHEGKCGKNNKFDFVSKAKKFNRSLRYKWGTGDSVNDFSSFFGSADELVDNSFVHLFKSLGAFIERIETFEVLKGSGGWMLASPKDRSGALQVVTGRRVEMIRSRWSETNDNDAACHWIRRPCFQV